MHRNDLDLSKLNTLINKKHFKLADVQHRLEKVAFDVVRFKDGDPDDLWQVQNSDDGDYIVAKYTENAVETKVAANHWDVIVAQGSSDLNIFYKGHPITKVACSQYGIDKEGVFSLSKSLPKKLATDKSYSKSLMDSLKANEKQAIFKLYPELSK